VTLAISNAPPVAPEKIPNAVPIARPGTWSGTHARATPSVAATYDPYTANSGQTAHDAEATAKPS
jgi:hypothetical protein